MTFTKLCFVYGDQIKKANLGGLFTMHGGKRNACKISFCDTKQTTLDVQAVIVL